MVKLASQPLRRALETANQATVDFRPSGEHSAQLVLYRPPKYLMESIRQTVVPATGEGRYNGLPLIVSVRGIAWENMKTILLNLQWRRNETTLHYARGGNKAIEFAMRIDERPSMVCPRFMLIMTWPKWRGSRILGQTFFNPDPVEDGRITVLDGQQVYLASV